MNRIVTRKEYEEETAAPGSLRIGVCGLSRGAGATFISEALAYAFALEKRKRVTFLDCAGYLMKCGVWPASSGFVYDSLGMEKRFAIRGFKDVFEMLEQGKSIRKVQNTDEKINWLLPIPGAGCGSGMKAAGGAGYGSCEKAVSRIRKAYQNCPGEIIICDFGSFFGEAFATCAGGAAQGLSGRALAEDDMLRDMDIVVAVIDPLPSALLQGERQLEYLKALKKDGTEVEFVLNKVNAGVGLHEVKSFLKLDPAGIIRAAAISEIYAAEFNCCLPAEFKSIRDEILQDIRGIARKIT